MILTVNFHHCIARLNYYVSHNIVALINIASPISTGLKLFNLLASTRPGYGQGQAQDSENPSPLNSEKFLARVKSTIRSFTGLEVKICMFNFYYILDS